MPEVDFHWVRELGEGYEELDDHDLVYQLHRVGFSVMVGGDYKLRSDPRVLVAVEQTRMSLLTIEGAGDDPILATGVLLRDLMPILRGDVPQGMLYKVRPTRVRGQRARKVADDLDPEITYRDYQDLHGLQLSARTMYPKSDARRIV